jgi:hypothetical protein
VGQPLAAVEPDLDVEREPGLQTGADEAEDRVSAVRVDVQALARPQTETALAGIRGAMVLEAHAGLDGLERADHPGRDGRLGQQAAGELLFVGGAGLEVADGPVVRDGLTEGRRLDAFAGRQDVVLEVEEADVRPLQEAEHAARPHQRQERATEDQTVEPGQHGGDTGTVAGKELGHGVVLEG